MNRFFGFFCAAVVMIAASSAQAFGGGASGFHLGLSALKYDVSASGDAFGENKNSRTHLDAKIGFLSDSEIYFGAIYSTLAVTATGSSPSRTATGATVGYHSDGWFFDLSYFLSSEYKMSNLETYKEGTGFQAEFGYNFMMSANFYMGLELAYKTLTYRKLNTGGADFSSTNTFTELMPLFNLGFYF